MHDFEKTKEKLNQSKGILKEKSIWAWVRCALIGGTALVISPFFPLYPITLFGSMCAS